MAALSPACVKIIAAGFFRAHSYFVKLFAAKALNEDSLIHVFSIVFYKNILVLSFYT